MVTVICFLTLLGFEMLYHTSEKAQFVRIPQLEAWARSNKEGVQLIALGLLLICLTGFIVLFGLGSGSFYFLAALMLAGGLAFLLSPIRHFKAQWIGLAFLFFFALELL
jgi:hypothetical protein